MEAVRLALGRAPDQLDAQPAVVAGTRDPRAVRLGDPGGDTRRFRERVLDVLQLVDVEEIRQLERAERAGRIGEREDPTLERLLGSLAIVDVRVGAQHPQRPAVGRPLDDAAEREEPLPAAVGEPLAGLDPVLGHLAREVLRVAVLGLRAVVGMQPQPALV